MGTRLVVDIGGTNARFALQPGPGEPLGDESSYPCADFAGVQELISHYLQENTDTTPTECAIGIASPVGGDRVTMTNLAWSFSVAELEAALGLKRLLVINDFTALALALPTLAEDELVAVGGGTPVDGRAWGLIGPGTGLGVGGLLPAPGGGYSAISGEGGHVTLAGADESEDAVLRVLRARFGHASAERALSGPGLENLYAACVEVDGASDPTPPAPEIAARAREHRDARAVRTVALFFGLLGSVAGNLALTLGAQRGVFIGGGIVPQLGDLIQRSSFRARFEAKGRYRDYLAAIPTWVVAARSSPALRGALQALELPAR
jgi:glucokinase